MGVKLKDFYDEARQIGGIAVCVALARYMALSSTRVMEAPDSPELIERFEKALQKIRVEYAADAATSAHVKIPASSTPNDVKQMRQVLDAIEREKPRYISDIKTTITRVTETVANELQIARVSVWFLTERCAVP